MTHPLAIPLETHFISKFYRDQKSNAKNNMQKAKGENESK